MATELDVAAAPPAPFTQEDIERVRQYEKIIKLSETITSGKHPRIKVPASLALSNRSTGSPSLAGPATAHTAKAGNGVPGAAKANERAFGANGQLPVAAASVAALPGLGLTPKEAVGSYTQLSGFASQRARVEAELREQSSQAAKPLHSESSDFFVDDVLQKARQLERMFTPPPLAISDITAAGKGAPSSAPADSGDDDTFYSSKFNTPEFGLTARIPAESHNGDASIHDSSDYEPELDIVPSPKQAALPPAQTDQPALPAQPQQEPSQAAPPFSQMSSEAASHIFASLVALHAQNATQAVPIPPPSFQNNNNIPQQAWQGSSATQTGPAPQVVRTHDLSPVAPQPEHISSLAVGTRLPEGPSGTFLSATTQAAILRQGEVSQSSPDSTSHTGGRFADRKKGKKNKAGGKRKAENGPTSPRIKSEPRSPSPIAAPLAPRPHKRQRQETRPVPAPAPAPASAHVQAQAQAPATAPGPGPGPVREAGYAYEGQYNAAAPRGPLEPRAQYTATRIVRENRAPVVYERAETGRYEHGPEAVVPRPQRGYETYEPVPAGFAPRHPQPNYQPPARPPSTTYAQVPVSQPQAPVPAGYPAQPSHVGHRVGHELSGRASVRPDAFERGHPPPPDMAPPPARVQRLSPAQGRILIDEFNREYFEPARPAAEPRQPAVVETVPYDASVVYERPASRQMYAAPAQRYAHVGPPMPAVYGEDDMVYRRTSPVYAPARRIVTQPEYVTREYVDYAPQREYSVRPATYAVAPPPPQAEHGGYALEEMPPSSAPPPREYLVRSSTARPPEAPRYDAPLLSRYVERVGSVRPPESTSGLHRGGAVVYETATGPRAYEGQMRSLGVPQQQHAGDGVYIEGHHGREVVREYSVRPEARVVAPREYGARSGPAPGPAPPPSSMPETPYYAENPPAPQNRAPQEYAYAEEGVPREIYR